MQLENWDRSRDRFSAFWRQELVDRCCIAVKGIRSNAASLPEESPPGSYEELKRRWIDPEYNLKRILKGFERVYCAGDSYPATTMCLGASAMAGFYGARVEFKPDTVWYHPVIDDITRFDWDIDIEKGPLYQETIDAASYYVRECRGRYLAGLPELGSATDNLSLLRGMQELVFDMLENPEDVRKGISAIAKSWALVHRKLDEISRPCNFGGCCIPWMQTWAPGPHYQMSCDFSTIISPEMYRDFILPELESYIAVNTYSVYHLDGPDEVKHLDMLLELPGLKAIQWTPGTGKPPTGSECWIPMYKRIQAAGKSLILLTAPDEVEPLMKQLSSKGLFMTVWAGTEGNARNLMAKIPGWTRD